MTKFAIRKAGMKSSFQSALRPQRTAPAFGASGDCRRSGPDAPRQSAVQAVLAAYARGRPGRPGPATVFGEALLGLLFCAFCALPAFTAQGASAQGAVRERPDGYLVEEIVVTARRREQRAFDVPLSFSTLHGSKLDALRVSGMDVRFLSNRVPSLQMESSYGRIYPRFYIRGLGNTDFDLNASQPVSLVYDGIVLENAMLKGFPAFDLERIEVLRGPQGTLFGRNTPAGVVKFESKRPTQTFEGYGRVSWGRFAGGMFEGALSGPLLENRLNARLSLLGRRRGDWIDNTHTGENDALGGYDEIAGRLQLQWQPSPDFSALLSVHARDLDATASRFRANLVEQGSGDLRPGIARDKAAYDGLSAQHLRAQGLAFELRYHAGGVRWVSLTGLARLDTFSRGDIDGGYGAVFSPPSGPGTIPFPSETGSGIPSLRQFSQELRLESPEQRTSWQVGLFYFRETVEMEDFNYDTLNEHRQDGFVRQHQRALAHAAFASATFAYTERLEFHAGLRISDDEKDYSVVRLASPASVGAGALGPVTRRLDGRVWSFDAGLRYGVSPGVQAWLRVARGFRAPSIQGRLLFSDEVTMADTETILSLEGGVKLRARKRRLHLDLAAFAFRMRDQQLTAVGGNLNTNRLINADRTDGHGLEAELRFAPSAVLQVTASVSYNYTRIDDPGLFIQPCASNCTLLDPPGEVANTVSIDGNRLPQAPRLVADLTLRYALPLSGGSQLVFFTDWAYRSRINFFLYESREYQDERLLEGAVRFAWFSPGERFSAALFGRNILDDKSRTGGVDFNNLAGFLNEPPTWGAELTLSL